MAGQHFARDLGVAWLVGSDQADQLNSQQEEEAAENDEGKSIGGAASAFVQAGRSRSQS